MTAQKNKGLIPILSILVLAFVFVFPRILIAGLGAENPWTSYLYQYGFGLIVFTIGIVLILKTGSCVLGRGNDAHWFRWLIGGFIFFAVLHAVWIILALSIPVKGGV
jgi:membrane protease YdiL (CAAX protease family)